MSTRQLNLSDFAEHCLDELKAVQKGDTVIEIVSLGKVVAVVNPPAGGGGGSLGDWMAFDCDAGNPAPVVEAVDDAWSQDVWHPLAVEEHAALQKTPIVGSVEELLGDGTAEEWEGFDEALERWRSEPMMSVLHDEAVSDAA